MFDISKGIITDYDDVDSALIKLLEKLQGKTIEPENINVEESLGRILYEDIVAKCDLPEFDTALVDGYAVNSHDIAHADSKTPVTLKIIAESNAGNLEKITVSKNEAVRISTGAILPENTDSIVLTENTSKESDKVRVFKSAILGENVARKGEDICAKELFIRKQRKIRPQDIGGILGLGYRSIQVFKKPVISVIPTGNELISINTPLSPGKLIETNSYVLKGLIDQLGGNSRITPIIQDNPELIKDAITSALKESDVVLVSGGSSAGNQDYTLKAIESIENSKVVAHGIAMRPGKQTLLAIIDGKPVIGLPGHPVSNVTAFLVFVKPVLVQLAGDPRSFWQERKDNIKIDAILARDVESPSEREDYVRVRLKLTDNGKITAYPYAGKSSFISTLVKAHGMIKLAPDCTKLYEGDKVEVILF